MQKSDLDQQYWADLKSKSALAGITLDEKITPHDFKTYGDRLAQRQLDLFTRWGQTPLADSVVVDVGCGLGRISLPFSRQFKKVIGIDINRRILDAGTAYCREAANIEFVENDGKTLPLPDASVDYVYSGGVLQHIKELDVILGYFREGMRVLKPNGMLNFSFQTWMDDVISGHNIGKKVTARDLEGVLAGFDILALVEDVKDPVPHMNIIVCKRPGRGVVEKSLLVEKPMRTGIWEDLPSYENFRALWAKPRRALTFW